MNAESKDRKTYCRACGANKGHSFAQCTNVSGLRAVIKCQDDEIAGLTDRHANAAELSKQAATLERQLTLHSRIIDALLTLHEATRGAS